MNRFGHGALAEPWGEARHPTFSSARVTHGKEVGGQRGRADGEDAISDHSDRRLVESVARYGDERSFRHLYDRHTPRLLRFVLRLSAGQEPQTAEDMVQETWIRAVETLDRFSWRSSFPTWLHGIAFNVVREERRRRFGRPDSRDHDDLSAGETTNSVAVSPHSRVDPEARIDLERALARLPVGRRTVLVLHDLYGYKHAEVAASLGISIGTSKSQLHDARVQLQSMLKREIQA